MGSRVYISPSRAFGAFRTRVRQGPPSYLDLADLTRATDALLAADLPRVAALLMLARRAGLRLSEASLADLKVWLREAARHGRINVQRGAKGGRRAPRWVHVTPELEDAIRFATTVAGSNCLLREGETLVEWYRNDVHRGRRILRRLGIRKIHDCRTAYACDRYRQMTGYPAPAISGVRLATRAADARARDQVAYELGHGRRDVVASYCGSSR
ncbi:integrase domain-containing protein [Alkalilimnicola ehrlichii]|uniref:integrase domain-containing protein n=1 Tax=Alkalilimnicola ehrlichii TaxID=351052 RepID=UPI003B9EDF77